MLTFHEICFKEITIFTAKLLVIIDVLWIVKYLETTSFAREWVEITIKAVGLLMIGGGLSTFLL
jgi:hypothetical protein